MEDPAEDGLNWYGYCGGNPVNTWDPSGLKINGYRVSRDLEYINTQIMKVLANKTAYKKATRIGASDEYKYNLTEWASNERISLLEYVNDEFANEGLAQLINEQISNGASKTVCSCQAKL